MIYICIPVFNRLSLTINCIDSILKQSYSDYKIVICDHSSSETSYNKLKQKFPNITILRGDESMWWTAATNMCIEYSMSDGQAGDYIFTLNNDTELDEKCLETLVKSSKDNSDSIIGCVNLLYDERDKIEPSSQIKRSFLGFGSYKGVNKWKDSINNFEGKRKVNALSGKGVLIPFTVFENIGLYNAEMLPHYHADTEFTIRASNAGYSIYLDYNSKLYSHYEETGATSRTSKDSFKSFYNSFFSIKSTRHFKSLKNREKLIHGSLYPLYLGRRIFLMSAGFLRNYLFPK